MTITIDDLLRAAFEAGAAAESGRIKRTLLEPDSAPRTFEGWLASDARLLHRGEISDGYYSFNDLYAHRVALFAALCRNMPGLAWRSRQHHPDDGPMYAGYFIAGLWLGNVPEVEWSTITYHCPDEAWDLFTGVWEHTHAAKWDGHTPEDVVARLNLCRP